MALTSIICISLYIALLATTFSRKYPQAVASALIMQADKCVQVERMVPKKTLLNMKAFFHEECAPLVSPLLCTQDSNVSLTLSIREKAIFP